EIKYLKPGRLPGGTATYVPKFRALVDIGVHQDGLVHLSALSRPFVKDPHTVINTGDVVKVKVLESDPVRKRIALTMRLDDPLPSANDAASAGAPSRDRNRPGSKSSRPAPGRPAAVKEAPKTGSFGNLLQDAFKKR